MFTQQESQFLLNLLEAASKQGFFSTDREEASAVARGIYRKLQKQGTPAAGEIVMWVDGGADSNPGMAGYGVYITDHEGKPIAELSGNLGVQTNNYAEYSALTRGLEWALCNDHREVSVKTDSELLVQQIRGNYRVKSENSLPLYEQTLKLAGQLERFSIERVSRKENSKADSLAASGIHRAVA